MDSNKLDETPSTARPFQKLRQLRPCGGGDCEGVKEAPTDEEENRCNVELGNVPIRSRRREHSVFTCSGVQSGRARRPATGTLNAKTSSTSAPATKADSRWLPPFLRARTLEPSCAYTWVPPTKDSSTCSQWCSVRRLHTWRSGESGTHREQPDVLQLAIGVEGVLGHGVACGRLAERLEYALVVGHAVEERDDGDRDDEVGDLEEAVAVRQVQLRADIKYSRGLTVGDRGVSQRYSSYEMRPSPL